MSDHSARIFWYEFLYDFEISWWECDNEGITFVTFLQILLSYFSMHFPKFMGVSYLGKAVSKFSSNYSTFHLLRLWPSFDNAFLSKGVKHVHPLLQVMVSKFFPIIKNHQTHFKTQLKICSINWYLSKCGTR